MPMKPKEYYLVNAITAYRVISAPVLMVLALTGNLAIFKWLLPISFFTDSIDGALARKLHVTSVFGSKLDSIGDDLSFLAALVGIFAFKLDFILANLVMIVPLLGLYLFQAVYALFKYGKITSFHTYLAKTAAISQGFFLIFLFLLPQPIYWLFYTALAITMLDLIEEIIILYLLPTWETNVKGLYWVLKEKKINSKQ
jgi:CDP-diacylglycerol--glycerol-3-phosphate 3-phosphatidyltransferase